MVSFDQLNVQKLCKKEINGLSLVKNGDVGSFSNVYKLNETECIKIFKKPKDYYELLRFNELTKLKYDKVILPKMLAIINKKFRGYTMDFIDGNILCYCFGYDFSLFIKKYKEFVDNVIDQISDDGIILYDCNSSNIMFDEINNCFVLIDPDEWSKHSIYDTDIKKKNYRMLVNTFYNFMFKDTIEPFDVDADFIDFYETKRYAKEKDTKIKINTIRDFIF